jgi:hypothetical protein
METEQPRIEYAISESHKGKLVQIHLIRMPEDRKRHPLKSLNGFRRRMTKMFAAYSDKQKGTGKSPWPPRSFQIQFIEDREAELEAFAETPELRDALYKAEAPDLTHENIFDFYSSIGYDHKRNRFDSLGAKNGEGQER